jgi:Tetratricopeptide repeat
MSRIRKAHAACALALAGVLVSRAGAAQRAHPHSGNTGGPRPGNAGASGQDDTPPLNLRHQSLETDPRADVARARMRGGDCAGALEGFDDALRSKPDPSVRRDRGICQARLGHPYPAIDDLRAYLMAMPDATDADGVREQLATLEQETLGYSSASTDVPGDVEGGASVGAASKQARSESDPATPVRDRRGQMDYVDQESDDFSRSPLRSGTGWSLAPFFSQRKWGVSPSENVAASQASGLTGGDGATWAECLGLGIRYAVSSSGALLLEAGYELFDSTASDANTVSGLSSEVGYEWRFPLDPTYRNQLVLALGLGYEHLAIRPSSPQASGTSVGAFVPRVRFGWRHMLATSTALDVSIDGGAVNFFAYSQFPYDPNSQTTYLVAVNAAVAWGL